MIIYEELFKKFGFSNSHLKIIELVGKNKKILEIGCSVGFMTKVFYENGCQVDLVEVDKKAINKARKFARKAINDSIENPKVIQMLEQDYDFIIMADVLEHLVDCGLVLKNLSRIGLPETTLIISLPNIASWFMRKQLFFKGNFEYQESGLLDKTHLHFFTVNSLPIFLKKSNWQVEELIGTILIYPFKERVEKIPIISFLINKIAEKYKNLSYFHFVTIAKKSV